jgi:hypothetical protein
VVQIVRLLIAALLVFVIVTVAAFRYLEWWQALLASGFTFLLLTYGAKVLIRYSIRRLTGGLDFSKGFEGIAASMFRTKSRVLKNATVDVHAVRPVSPPEDPSPDASCEEGESPPDLNWYAFDVTIFPDRRSHSPMSHWDLDDLLLVPADAEVTEEMESLGTCEEFGLHDLRLVADGDVTTPDQSKFHGPQRLRFSAGISKPVREVKFRYYFEAFGRTRLPDAISPARIAPGDG